jgi:formate hydrogenlyase transcriptional activator
LERVLEQARTVASTDASVLILGETGTGKDLVAHAIHRISKRKDKNFVKVNCAAIPSGLLESELFGHEKGAFTGAIMQKVGRLELADEGTLLLDEIGDLPLELQPKLLRVLQDGEFERLGGTRTIRVNVRLIASTNRDLAKRITDNRFRGDLFYRLNVFPIRIPALRQRREDIPQLAQHFVSKFGRLMGKNIETIPNELMEALQRQDWPGNVRELEHFVERSVIMTSGPVLEGAISELLDPASVTVERTLAAVERDYILQVLKGTRGKLSGINGAAAKLGMKRTTLQSRMLKLNINSAEFRKGAQ